MDAGDLTEAQQKVLRFVFRRISVGEASPSFGEIAAHFGYRSRMAAHKHVQALMNCTGTPRSSGRSSSCREERRMPASQTSLFRFVRR